MSSLRGATRLRSLRELRRAWSPPKRGARRRKRRSNPERRAPAPGLLPPLRGVAMTRSKHKREHLPVGTEVEAVVGRDQRLEPAQPRERLAGKQRFAAV